MYAINICDLTDLKNSGPISIVGMLLRDFIPAYNQNTVAINRNRLDTDAVILNGPAANDLERVEALIAFLQISLGPRQLHLGFGATSKDRAVDGAKSDHKRIGNRKEKLPCLIL